MEQNQNQSENLVYRPATGNALAVAAGISFYFLGMILTLVGPAGSKVPHAAQNKATFLSMLMLTLFLAGCAAFSKLGRRRFDGSGLPYASFALCAVCILTLIVLLFDGFAI